MNQDSNQLADLVDSAYAQNIITYNEVRKFLKLDPVPNGDVCKNGKKIKECVPKL